MSRWIARVTAGVLALAGCGGAGNQTARVFAVDGPVAPRPAPSTGAAWRLHDRSFGPELGDACSATADGALLRPGPCGTKNRIALEEILSQSLATPGQVPPPPCAVKALRLPDGDSPAYAAAACIAGDELLYYAPCMSCRLPDVGTAIHAQISELTDSQLAWLGSVMNVPTPVPTTGAGWSAFFAAHVAPVAQ